ncbi:peroxiredoxin [Actinomyces qiguomingii]|uniref:peroxiredoxin n=1 Tax=Actinomyces qiguomingii TaxID=2057800 RepID=UPI000CA074AE|nr:peroxiredoxin [Actinomyces qiguomingii]
MAQLTAGDTAPDFTLPDQSGNPVSLSTLREGAEHGVVVYFYPRAETPGCTKEACDFRDSLEGWREAGYAVVGISPDPPAAQARFAEKQSLPFPLLSDPDHAVMQAWGAWGEKKNYGRTTIGTIRSTVVVGTDGRVILGLYNVRATGHVDRLRRELGIVS